MTLPVTQSRERKAAYNRRRQSNTDQEGVVSEYLYTAYFLICVLTYSEHRAVQDRASSLLIKLRYIKNKYLNDGVSKKLVLDLDEMNGFIVQLYVMEVSAIGKVKHRRNRVRPTKEAVVVYEPA